MYLLLVIAIKQIAHGKFGRRVFDLVFQKLEIVVCVAVDDGDADVVVGVVGVGGLVDFGGAGREDVGGVEFGVHGVGLAGVYHEEDFVVADMIMLVDGLGSKVWRDGGMNVPFLLPHLAERICKVESADFLRVLELEELVSAMPGHVYEDVTPFVRH